MTCAAPTSSASQLVPLACAAADAAAPPAARGYTPPSALVAQIGNLRAGSAVIVRLGDADISLRYAPLYAGRTPLDAAAGLLGLLLLQSEAAVLVRQVE